MVEIKQKKSRTASPEVRKKQIIEATITSISKHGISGTTMASVARLAGLSAGLANFYFKSKDALLEETLRCLAMEHREQWSTRLQAPDLDAPAKIVAVIDAQFHTSICNRKKLAVWFAFFGEAAYRKSYRRITTSIDAERLEVLAGLFDQIIKEDGGPLDPKGVARTLESLFDGFWLNMLMYPDQFSREMAKAQIFDYLHTSFPRHFTPLS